MASLMRLLFDTMPLAGARRAAAIVDGASGDKARLATLRDHLAYCPDRSYLAAKNTGLSEDQRALHRHFQPIWSFDASKSLTRVQNLSVRGEQEGYKDCLVVENLEFGVDLGSGFENVVQIDLPLRGKHKFTLTQDALIASFLARGGRSEVGDDSWWPIDAWHEFGVMHAFLYDVDLLTGNVTPATQIADPELDLFRQQLRRLQFGTSLAYNGRIEDLYVDNAWREVVDPTVIMAQIALDGVGGLWGSNKKTISVAPHRILICASVTMHHSNDDFTPAFRFFQAAWGARLYGVIMVNSTHPTGEVVAGVRHVRPKVTTIDGVPSAPCHCSEMNKEIGSLLVTDANAGDQRYADYFSNAHPPWPAWNSIFAYYVSDADRALAGASVLAVNRDAPEREVGYLARFEDSDGRVRFEPRQGAFDNIHIAPTMRMPDISHVDVAIVRQLPTPTTVRIRVPVPTSDRESWRLNNVSMAPICAHDCFHFHWRWSDSVSAADLPAMGWRRGLPYQKVGAPLVPENQNVYVCVPDARTLDYRAHCGPFNAAGDWQIVNHHGGDYVLSTTSVVDNARYAQDVDLIATSAPVVSFVDRSGRSVGASDYWAVFYWRNRYYLEVSELADDDPGGDLVGTSKNPPGRYQVEVCERVAPAPLRDLLREAQGLTKPSGRH